MLFTGSFLTDLLALTLTFVIIVTTYFKWRFNYWNKRNVPCIQPSFPFGNLENPLRATKTLGLHIKDMYDELKERNAKHAGIYFFTMPTYLVTDLELVKNVLTKDFQYFTDRGFYYNEEVDPISAHLLVLGGTKWRNLRAKLSPTFTSGKMKMMFQTLLDCEENLQKKIHVLCAEKQPIDIKDVLGCYTTDVIGSCAFGLDCNTFKEDNSPFREFGKKAFKPGFWQQIRNAFMLNFADLAHFLKMKVIPEDISDFFMKIVKDTVEYREKSGFTRKDFMQLLIDMKNNKVAEEEGYQHDGKTLTFNEIAAQSFIFFLAGFETSSTTMTFALYELARNQDIQNKVRDEINTVLEKYDGKVTYEAIQEMKYLQKVIDETLRKYPALPFLTRECVKNYKVPGEDLIIEKGTRVLISIIGTHYDEDFYPDPEKFDPERFNEENVKTRPSYTYFPFGEGPRICIGMRFGLMQTKVGLTSLLRKYRFTVNRKTQEPLDYETFAFILTVKGDIWLNAEKLA